MPYVEPSSKNKLFAKIDCRSKEGKYLNQIKRKLIKNCGGLDVSFPKLEIIDRAAWLALCITKAEAKIACGDSAEIENYAHLCTAYANVLASLDS